MTCHECKSLGVGMKLGDRDPKDAMATPDTVCEGSERTRSDSTWPGSVLSLSRVSEQHFGIVAMDLKFCRPRHPRHKLKQTTMVLLDVAVAGSQSTHRRAPAWWRPCSCLGDVTYTGISLHRDGLRAHSRTGSINIHCWSSPISVDGVEPNFSNTRTFRCSDTDECPMGHSTTP